VDPTPTPIPAPTPTLTPIPEENTAVIEIPTGALDGIVINIPTWVGEVSAFGITAGATFAVVEMVAHKWLRYSPLLRRLFPKVFAGSWDEYVDEVAKFIKGSDVRFIDTPEKEIKAVVKDPDKVAQLLTTGAKLASIPESGSPGLGRSTVSHVEIEPEKAPEAYPNQWLWDRVNLARKKK